MRRRMRTATVALLPVAASQTTPSNAAGQFDVPVFGFIPAVSLRTESVALAPPPPDSLTPVAWAAANHTEIPLPEFEPVAATYRVGLDTNAALTPGVTENDDWWITGAVKRTGSSLARTGARTKASFVDVFRAVNRAVRRALPD